MTEQRQHLQSIIQQQKTLLDEIQDLNNKILEKKEIVLKMQGVIEYLQQIGVSLEEPPSTEEAQTSVEE
jgi:uncharacterized protein YlxW (UPF0749 family)